MLTADCKQRAKYCKSLVLDNRSCKASQEQKVMTKMTSMRTIKTKKATVGLRLQTQTRKKKKHVQVVHAAVVAEPEGEEIQRQASGNDGAVRYKLRCRAPTAQERAKQTQMLAEREHFRVKMTMIYLWEKLLPAAAVPPACPDFLLLFFSI